MKQDIKFGTDGWRAIIAKDYTVENVARVAEATAVWLIASENYSSVVIGFDPRFGGKLFAETSCKVFLHYVKWLLIFRTGVLSRTFFL